jgi:chromosome segregation ATPase
VDRDLTTLVEEHGRRIEALEGAVEQYGQRLAGLEVQSRSLLRGQDSVQESLSEISRRIDRLYSTLLAGIVSMLVMAGGAVLTVLLAHR